VRHLNSRRFVLLLVGVLIMMVVAIEPAGAYVDTGRDDADPGTYFDIASTSRAVWFESGGVRRLRIWVAGTEPLYEFAPLKLRIRLDTHGDQSADALMVIRNGDSASGDRVGCVVVAGGVVREGSWLTDPPPSSGVPAYYDRIGCQIQTRFLRPTKQIRWRVTSAAFSGMSADRAPDRGWYS